MPVVQIPPKSICTHYGIHPKWRGTQGIWAVCQMPKPYLLNAIDMLRHTLDMAYPIEIGKRSPLTFKEILETEDALRMLEGELKRRIK